MNNELMAPRKNKRSEASKAIAQAIIDQYKPTSAEEMQDALKDIFGPMFEPMLQGEMDSHLGYESNDRGYKDTNNRRNGYTHKTLKTTMEMSKLMLQGTGAVPLIHSLFPKGRRM